MTAPITWATVAEVAVVVAMLAPSVRVLDLVGAVAFVVGRIAGNSILIPGSRKARASRVATPCIPTEG